ncbi:hypothetical protein ACVWXN_007103 [Bradyrhizobium sp. i1.4.4]|uniref:hypothetical protein n=1 Tax=Bradyrhizobium TaxID=374 RepID=UPI0024B177EA|nr:hypothetical protein [Bradyrhizobium barranii]WFT96889.1 hypothetical protein QA633_07355 [Bradyrhizobium barranii]
MQAYPFGFGDFGEMLAVVGDDLFLGPSCYSCCDVPPTNASADKFGDELAKLFVVAKSKGIGFAEGFANGGVASGRALIALDEGGLEKVDFLQLVSTEPGFRIGLRHIGERQRR